MAPTLVMRQVMTTQPHWIDADDTLDKAKTMMAMYRIRHLPVMKGPKVLGILSDRDLKMAAGIGVVEPGKVRVGALCHGNPFITEPQHLVSDVVKTMAVQHYGSAIVVEGGKLVGIFTTVDVCRLLAKILEGAAGPTAKPGQPY